jgi:hypothetical protein
MPMPLAPLPAPSPTTSLLDDSCLKPFADRAQHPPVRDPVLEELQHPPAVDGVLDATDVRVEQPVHLPPVDPGRERIQRAMRAAPSPEPVAEAEEVRPVDGVERLDDGHAGGACPPIRQPPTGRRRPSAFGIHTLGDGLARHAPP